MENPTRRTVVAASIAAALAPRLRAQTSTPKLGVIGLGNRAQRHLQAYREMGDVEVAALSDVQAERMRSARSGPAADAEMYVDYRELLADKSVETVVIVVPNYLHAKIAIEAMEAGKDVLMEKPIGLNYAEAKAVAAAVERTGRVLGVGMQRHYFSDYIRIIDLVKSGRIGQPRLFSLNEFRGDWNPRTWQGEDPETGKTEVWRHRRSMAGSSLLEFSVHSYGFLYEMIETPLTKCAATGGAVHFPERTTEDVIAVIAEFGEVRLQHTYSGFTPGAQWQLTIAADDGWLQYDRRTATVKIGDADPAPFELPRDDQGSNEAQMYREFFEAVRTRRQPTLNATFAVQATKLAYAAWMSIDENRFITDADFA